VTPHVAADDACDATRIDLCRRPVVFHCLRQVNRGALYIHRAACSGMGQA
jgi:hypothetical protein